MNATAEAPLFTSEDFPLLQSDLGKQLPTNVKTTTVNGDAKGEDPELQGEDRRKATELEDHRQVEGGHHRAEDGQAQQDLQAMPALRDASTAERRAILQGVAQKAAEILRNARASGVARLATCARSAQN